MIISRIAYLAPESTSLPLTTSAVPESLPLCWEVTISGWDTEEESIVLLELLWVGEDWVAGLCWCVHLAQDLVGESLLDLVNVDLAASGLDALGLSLSQLGDMAVHGVLLDIRGQFILSQK